MYIQYHYDGDDDDDGGTLLNNKSNICLENLISIGVNLIKSGHTLCHSRRIKQKQNAITQNDCSAKHMLEMGVRV